jgi:outer membrane immunogenic protein
MLVSGEVANKISALGSCGMRAGGCRCTVLAALALIAGAASARPDVPWDGAYLGANFGEASNSTCNTWSLNGAGSDNRVCSSNGAFVGGVQVGENFQYKRFVWGIGADLDFESAKNLSQSLKYSGTQPPPGTYEYSSKQNPGGFAIVAPRIGYGGDTWFPYLRAGAIIAEGSHDSALAYTPAGATKSTASFSGGKDFTAAGWVAGGGVELGLNGAWSITAEYLHANLGKGSDSTSACSGVAPACAPFSGTSFDNSHQGFSANIFRVGITYWFRYW